MHRLLSSPFQRGAEGEFVQVPPRPTTRHSDAPTTLEKGHGLPIASERRYELQKKQEKGGLGLQSAVDRGLPAAGIAEVHALADAFAMAGAENASGVVVSLNGGRRFSPTA